MSVLFGRQEHFFDGKDGHARLNAIDAHAGNSEDFRQRYLLAAHDAVQHGPQAVRALGPDLLRLIADARNLHLAWDYLSHNGGQAPGPRGWRFNDFERQETWELVRVLGHAVLHGNYCPGPARTKDISKGAARGDRTLTIAEIMDRVVARAVVQIIQPLHDPNFDENSFGFRPGRGRELALATALALTEREERYVWLVEDLQNAFDRVPHNRLLDVLHKTLPADVVQLVARIIDNGSNQGLPQGSPLSPLLLNVYLSHFLDTPWRKLHSHLSLLRYADDLLILCRTGEEAQSARHDLEHLLTPAAMLLKHCKDPVRDLAAEQHTVWLGFQVEYKGRLIVSLAEEIWDKLRKKLELAHAKPNSPLRAYATIQSWIGQLGPCYPNANRTQVYATLAEIARKLDFNEIPNRNYTLRRWKGAYVRWQRLREIVGKERGAVQAPRQSGGSAYHVFSACCGRGDGASAEAPSPLFSTQDITIFTDGCCLRNKVGGWAYLMESADGSRMTERSGELRRTTNNRAELLAVIKGLESLTSPATVRLVSDSEYVVLGVNERLPIWKARGWRCGSHKHQRSLENADLWRRLDIALAGHRVICEHVRGHAGHPQNETCDRLARAAAGRILSRH